MTEREIYKKAQKKVKAKKGFYSHLGVYCASIIFLFVVNWMTSPGFWWVVFPIFGWGIGIVGHYTSVFGFPGKDMGEDWEERELEKEVNKLKLKNGLLQNDENITLPDDELELKEFKKLRDEWEDKDFV